MTHLQELVLPHPLPADVPQVCFCVLPPTGALVHYIYCQMCVLMLARYVRTSLGRPERLALSIIVVLQVS